MAHEYHGSARWQQHVSCLFLLAQLPHYPHITFRNCAWNIWLKWGYLNRTPQEIFTQDWSTGLPPVWAHWPIQLPSLQINSHNVEDSLERVDLQETVPQINGLNIVALTFSLKSRLKNHSCRLRGWERTSSRSAWPFPDWPTFRFGQWRVCKHQSHFGFWLHHVTFS